MAGHLLKIKKEFENPSPQIMGKSWMGNVEIISFVCEFLNRSALAVLARTARGFTEPALDSLWKNQEDLVFLVQCFPRSLWRRGPTQRRDVDATWQILSFQRRLRQNDWLRFDFYARRVRKLRSVHHTYSRTKCDIHPNVIIELMAYRPSRVLMPNLRTIVYAQSWLADLGSTSFGQILLGPSLTEVSIVASDIPDHAGKADSSLELLCEAIQRLCPNIQSLTFIHLERAPVRVLPAIYELVKSQKHLNTLCLKSAAPSEDLLTHLSVLPTLHTLEGVRVPASHVHFYTTRDGRFPRLHTLAFATPNWTQAALAVTALQRPLRSLTINTLDTEPVAALGMFVDALATHPALRNLVNLDLTGRRLYLDTSPGGSGVPLVLKTLFSCSALQRLRLHSPVFVELDDTWLESAARAWPLLTALSVTVAPPLKPPRITLTGLIPLIKSCPLLKTLGLPLQAGPVDSTLLDGVRNKYITKLELEYSTITQPGQVFRALIAMFPNLGRIEHEYREKESGIAGEMMYMYWASVNKLLLASGGMGVV